MHLTQIWTYPIKSCRGVSCEKVRLKERGLSYDRHWMVVTPEGAMVTLREAPTLIRVLPQFADDHLKVTAPSMPPLELPYLGAGPKLHVKLWEGWTDATVLADASAWFKRYLRQDVLLVAVARDNTRVMNPNFGARRLSFVDSSPLNILGEASLADLNGRLRTPVSVEQFRPNLVFAGGEAYAEDAWRRVRIGAVPFDVCAACERCMVVNISADGTYSREPLATLAKYRRYARNVRFGQNINHLELGELRIGDELQGTAYESLDVQ